MEAICFMALLVWIFIQLGHALDSYFIAIFAAILIGGLDYAVGKTLHNGWNKLVILRVAIASVVSATLALGFLLDRNANAFDTEAKVLRAEQMAPLMASFNALLAQDRADLIGARSKQFDIAREASQGAEAKLLSAQKARNQSATKQRGYLIESGDQLEGFAERLPGCGELCLAARRRADLQAERIRTLDTDIQGYRLEAQQTRLALTEVSNALESANRAYEQKEVSRNAELLRDPRYLPEATGEFTSRFSGLMSLTRKPGGSALYITFFGQLLLFILLDLAYLAMRQSATRDDVHPDIAWSAVVRERQSEIALAVIRDLKSDGEVQAAPAAVGERPRSTVVPIDLHRPRPPGHNPVHNPVHN